MRWNEVIALRSEIVGAPDFDKAVLAYTVDMLRLKREFRFAAKLIDKEDRFRALKVYIYLNYVVTSASHDGISLSDFQNYAFAQAGVSRRTVRTTLALLQHFGFVRREGDIRDGRRSFYIAEEQLYDYAAGWLKPSLSALAHVYEPVQRSAEITGEAVRASWLSGGEDYAAGRLLFYENDEFATIFGFMEGGSIVVKEAVEAQIAGRRPKNHAEIARAYNISRTQVSTVIAEGRSLGLFETGPVPVPTPKLREDYAYLVSMLTAFCAVHWMAGREAVG